MPRAEKASPRHQTGTLPRRQLSRVPLTPEEIAKQTQAIAELEHERYLNSPRTRKIIRREEKPILADGYDFPEPGARLEIVTGNGTKPINMVVMRNCGRVTCNGLIRGDGNTPLCGNRMASRGSRRRLHREQFVEEPNLVSVMCGNLGVIQTSFATPLEQTYALSAYDESNTPREADLHIN
jgi:hypothetical protein